MYLRYRWLVNMWLAYGGREDLAAISLQRQTVQVLYRYCPGIVQILYRYCPGTVQVSSRYYTGMVKVLNWYCPGIIQVVYKYF